MKKSIFYLVMLAVVCIACEPSEDRQSPGGAITADQLNITATPEVVNGVNSNKVILENRSPVLSHWDYGLGTTTRAYDEVLVGSAGNVTIKFTGLNADGTYITKDLIVQVDEIVYETPYVDPSPYVASLTGGSEKAWTWDDAQPDGAVWGNGNYRNDTRPSWWSPGLSGMDEQAPGEGERAYMVFTADGDLTKYFTTGSTEKGSFSVNVNKDQVTYNNDEDAIWAVGKLNTSSVTVLSGISPNDDGKDVYSYDILSLDDNNMILAYPTGDDNGSGEAFYWMFKAR